MRRTENQNTHFKSAMVNNRRAIRSGSILYTTENFQLPPFEIDYLRMPKASINFLYRSPFFDLR